MNTWFFKKSNFAQWLPRLQAHRGYCLAGAPENSLASIQKALELDYPMAEFDVRITKDGELILNHDPIIDGHVIKTSTFEFLSTFRKLETLDQIFQWLMSVKEKDFKLNVELKSRSVFRADLEKATCLLVQKYGLQSRVMISSFNPMSLAWVRFYDSKIYRGLLLTFENEKGNHWIIKKMFLNILAAPHGLNLRFQDWSAEMFKGIGPKFPVVLWTCNDLKFYKEVKSQIHGIISDEITPADLDK